MGIFKNDFTSGINELGRPLRLLGIKAGEGKTGVGAVKEGFTAPITHLKKQGKALQL